MKKETRVRKNGSPRAPVLQAENERPSDRPNAAAGDSRESKLPMLAVFPQGEDGGLAEDLVDLSLAEWGQIKRAARGARMSPGLYMANAALSLAQKHSVPPRSKCSDRVKYQILMQAGADTDTGCLDLPYSDHVRMLQLAKRCRLTLAQCIMQGVVTLLLGRQYSYQPRKGARPQDI